MPSLQCVVCGETDPQRLTRCDYPGHEWQRHCGAIVCSPHAHHEGYGDERDIVDGAVFTRCPVHADPAHNVDRLRALEAALYPDDPAPVG
jgi:hypothetical protein